MIHKSVKSLQGFQLENQKSFCYVLFSVAYRKIRNMLDHKLAGKGESAKLQTVSFKSQHSRHLYILFHFDLLNYSRLEPFLLHLNQSDGLHAPDLNQCIITLHLVLELIWRFRFNVNLMQINPNPASLESGTYPNLSHRDMLGGNPKDICRVTAPDASPGAVQKWHQCTLFSTALGLPSPASQSWEASELLTVLALG